MSIEIKERDNRVNELPRPKDIFISGESMGEATPKMYGDKLVWHASIQLKKPTSIVAHRLVQGHGASPHEAVANAIVSAREERDWFAQQLAWLENELGTADKSNDVLKKAW